MPYKPPRPCSHRGCPALVWDGAYCTKHAPRVSPAYEAQRGTAAQRGYGSRWRRFRLMYLREHPICVDPFGDHERDGVVVAATDVDHITPRRAGGSDDDDNLQALCKSCHSRKTLEEQRGGEGGSNLWALG